MATKKTAAPVALRHPTIPGLTRQVRPAQVEEWLAMGWLLDTKTPTERG